MMEDLLSRAIHRLRRTLRREAFRRATAHALDTAPLAMSGSSPLFLSMVRHGDVVPYLLAIKSLYAAIGVGRVAVIDDGSLTGDDRRILHRHLPGIAIFDIAAIDTGRCPRGGTWERLVQIVDLTAETYVIQADADTLVTGPVPEVVQCWRENRSFLLGTAVGRKAEPAAATARMVQGWIAQAGLAGMKIGTLAEAALDQLPDAARRSYVHASSGFAGFAQGRFGRAELERFSLWMQDRFPTRWADWGSEQIASNYLLANDPGAVVLPFERYCCFEPPLPDGTPALYHFIGTHRYEGGVYRRRAREFLAGYATRTQAG